MNPSTLGDLWSIALHDHALLTKISEEIIERFYRAWLRPGDRAIDVGANVGRHLFPLAEAVGEAGHVFGFEPVPSLAAELQKEIQKRNLAGRVQIQQAAVSDAAGRLTFYEVPKALALSGLKVRDDLKADQQVNALEVDVVTLDETIKEPVRFIKIDVEGAEFNVFQGARRLLMEQRPIVAFEDGRGRSAGLYGYQMAEFYEFFNACGYIVLDIFGFPIGNDMTKYAGPWNFFAVPKSNGDARDVITCANMSVIWKKLSALKK